MRRKTYRRNSRKRGRTKKLGTYYVSRGGIRL
jgi:hypothetical protein